MAVLGKVVSMFKGDSNKLSLQEMDELSDRSSQVPLTRDPESPNDSPDLPGDKERESWGNKAEFLLATIGLAVGLGNIWRFPYLCQKNGGGAFLIPFFTFMIIEGMPLFFMELGAGQRFRKTAVEVWGGIHSSLKGIGFSCMIVSTSLCVYYIVVISWCCYYFFMSFTANLPWQKKFCPTYGSYSETLARRNNASVMSKWNVTGYDNLTRMLDHKLANWPDCCVHDPPQYYWYEKALRISSHMTDSGVGMNWQLFGCLIFSWVFVYFCIVKGIKSSGKAVYFTATFPYVVLIVLFFRGVTLPGAEIGIKAFFTPKWELLAKPEIWRDAATQIFFSLSLGFGALIAFASYNPINNNIIRDAYIVVGTDCFTALFGGIVVFSILGYREYVTGIPVTESGSGPGLAFVTFSDAMLLMDISPLWAVLFFFMLILLGIDSQFGTLEAIIAPLYDTRLVTMKRWKFLAIVCFVMFVVGLSMVVGPGYYVFQIFDDNAVTIPLLIIAFAQCVAIAWVYGSDKFADDIEFMTGRRPWSFWMLCWKYLSPMAILVILLWTLVESVQQKPTYTAYIGCPQRNGGAEEWTKKINYPGWAQALAAIIVIGTVIPIPVFMVKNWPSNWRQLFSEKLCSGWANYMPDPAAWKTKHIQRTMVYEPANSQDDNEKS